MFLDLIRDNAAFFSICAVAAGWFLTRRGQIHGDRSKNSYGFPIWGDEKLVNSLRVVGHILDKSEIYVEKSPNDEISGALWDCLQFMERAAVNIDMGYLSEEHFYKQCKSVSERVFIASSDLISKIREEKNSDTLYKNYEVLFVRTFFHRMPFWLSVFEFLTVCPCYRYTGRIFAAHLKTMDGSFFSFLRGILRNYHLPRKITYVRDLKKVTETFRVRIRQLIIFELFISFALLLLIGLAER